jgi:hypothetical protein
MRFAILGPLRVEGTDGAIELKAAAALRGATERFRSPA